MQTKRVKNGHDTRYVLRHHTLKKQTKLQTSYKGSTLLCENLQISIFFRLK